MVIKLFSLSGTESHRIVTRGLPDGDHIFVNRIFKIAADL